MTAKTIFRTLAALALAGTATQAAAGGWGTYAPQTYGATAKDAKACAVASGHAGPFMLDYSKVDGIQVITVPATLGVTAKQSARINLCLAEISGLVTYAADGTGTYIRAYRGRCPTGVLVGGDSYCIKDPWE